MHLLASGERQFDLRSAAAVEIDGQRNERQSLPSHRAVQLGYLTTLQQQLTLPARLVVQAVAVAVFRDVAVAQPDLVTFGGRVAFSDRAFALAQRFHLGSGELDASLEPLLDEIVEASAPVLGHDLSLVEGLRKRLGHETLRSIPRARALHRQHVLTPPKLRPAAAAAPAGNCA